MDRKLGHFPQTILSGATLRWPATNSEHNSSRTLAALRRTIAARSLETEERPIMFYGLLPVPSNVLGELQRRLLLGGPKPLDCGFSSTGGGMTAENNRLYWPNLKMGTREGRSFSKQTWRALTARPKSPEGGVRRFECFGGGQRGSHLATVTRALMWRSSHKLHKLSALHVTFR